jgi:hypothetical protein
LLNLLPLFQGIKPTGPILLNPLHTLDSVHTESQLNDIYRTFASMYGTGNGLLDKPLPEDVNPYLWDQYLRTYEFSKVNASDLSSYYMRPANSIAASSGPLNLLSKLAIGEANVPVGFDAKIQPERSSFFPWTTQSAAVQASQAVRFIINNRDLSKTDPHYVRYVYGPAEARPYSEELDRFYRQSKLDFDALNSRLTSSGYVPIAVRGYGYHFSKAKEATLSFLQKLARAYFDSPLNHE